MKIGKLLVTKELVNSAHATTLFSLIGFVPVRVELMYMYNRFEMIGISDLFEELPECAVAPTYNIIITSDDDGVPVAVVAEKVEP